MLRFLKRLVTTIMVTFQLHFVNILQKHHLHSEKNKINFSIIKNYCLNAKCNPIRPLYSNREHFQHYLILI
ncbi:hypothetical protein THIOSC15_1920013 [uncultured Thiomicrorhabdus sp.]